MLTFVLPLNDSTLTGPDQPTTSEDDMTTMICPQIAQLERTIALLDSIIYGPLGPAIETATWAELVGVKHALRDQRDELRRELAEFEASAIPAEPLYGPEIFDAAGGDEPAGWEIEGEQRGYWIITRYGVPCGVL